MSQQEFIHYFDTYYAALYRFIYFRVQHQQYAEDIVAHVFEKALEYHQNNSDIQPESVRALLYTIARNAVIDHYRWSAKKSHDNLEWAEALPSTQPSVADAIDSSLALEQIRHILETLPDRQRELVIMKYDGELANKEIAAALGITERSVSSQLSKAIKRIQQTIDTQLSL